MRLALLLVAISISLSSLCQSRGKIFRASRIVITGKDWKVHKIPITEKSFMKITDGVVYIKTAKTSHSYTTYGPPETRQEEDVVSHTWDCNDEKGKYCKFIMKIMTIDKIFIISIVYPNDDLILEYVTN